MKNIFISIRNFLFYTEEEIKELEEKEHTLKDIYYKVESTNNLVFTFYIIIIIYVVIELLTIIIRLFFNT